MLNLRRLQWESRVIPIRFSFTYTCASLDGLPWLHHGWWVNSRDSACMDLLSALAKTVLGWIFYHPLGIFGEEQSRLYLWVKFHVELFVRFDEFNENGDWRLKCLKVPWVLTHYLVSKKFLTLFSGTYKSVLNLSRCEGLHSSHIMALRRLSCKNGILLLVGC